jgi:UDP-glucose 4-epimerase
MRILVTGGAGFIGSHIVDQIAAAGHEPFVVDDLSSGNADNLPSDVPLFEVDIRNADELRGVFIAVRPDAISHQAAQMSVSRSVREPAYDAGVNVMGLLNVLGLALEHNVGRFVFASSGGVLYGDVDAAVPETHPADPISPYGISKWVGERYLQFYAREFGLQSVAMRYANVYGPRQNPHGEAGVVAIFCQKMLRGEQTTINGDGKYIRDYVYGVDVARANLAALTKEMPSKFEPFNIGTSLPTDTNEIAELIHQFCKTTRSDTPAPVHGPARAGDLRSSRIDYGKAQRVLGWKPTVKLVDGIRDTVAWFAEQIHPKR